MESDGKYEEKIWQTNNLKKLIIDLISKSGVLDSSEGVEVGRESRRKENDQDNNITLDNVKLFLTQMVNNRFDFVSKEGL